MWIKVCGLTNVENARAVASCGVDAVGLNFYERSKRSISIDQARQIVEALPARVTPVGLFVNHTLAEIFDVTSATGIQTVQLHGDESPEFAAGLTGLNVIRACRVDAARIDHFRQEVSAYRAIGVRLWAVLVDAYVTGEFGGTGSVAPWQAIASAAASMNLSRLILAGGLTPDNVQAAVHTVQPWGVDTASGVESSPGIKDVHLVQQFIQTARQKAQKQSDT